MKIKLPAYLHVIGRSVVDWWDSALTLALIFLIWLVAQVTIVLGPPATFGIYFMLHALITNGENLGIKGMIEGARKYWRVAWLWGLANLLVAFLVFANFNFYDQIGVSWGVYAQVFVLTVGAIWLATQFYALPFFMEQTDQRLILAWRNGLLTTLASPFFTLMLMIFCGLTLSVTIMFVLPILLGMPIIIAILGLRGVNDRLIAFGVRPAEKTPREIERDLVEQHEITNRPNLRGLGASPGSQEEQD